MLLIDINSIFTSEVPPSEDSRRLWIVLESSTGVTSLFNRALFSVEPLCCVNSAILLGNLCASKPQHLRMWHRAVRRKEVSTTAWKNWNYWENRYTCKWIEYWFMNCVWYNGLKYELLSSVAYSEGSNKATSEHKNLWKLNIQQLDKMLHDWLVMKHLSELWYWWILLSKAKDFAEQTVITEKCAPADRKQGGWTH